MAGSIPPTSGQGARFGRKKGQRKKPRKPRSNAGNSVPSGSAGKTQPPASCGGGSNIDAMAAMPAASAPDMVMPTPPVAALDRPMAWQKPFPHYRQAYAAIDLGTNNCRLLIARPSGEHFVVIDAFSRVVRLGEGLAQTGRLSDAAMDRALGALHVCADKLRKRNVHLARSVATEACRRATNGQQFIDRVLEETGIHLNIITAQEEARLAVLGCHILLEQGTGPAMIFDIGGGSTEMVLVETGETVPRILDWQSVPWGVVSLTESIGAIADDPHARAAAYAEMRRRVDEGFADFCERVGPMRSAARGEGRIRLLGTSGTVTTLASVHLELPQYDRRAVDGLVVPADSMRDISRRLATMTPAERIALPCIGRERSDLVVAGCAILESIIDIWPADRLGIADRGIREGILRSLMAIGADPRSPKRTEAA
ncbi:MAG: exopolyphosphatase [Novosphingobium sp. 17-62-19]|nr:Ppx/GppA phosphatase family protein [Novosphingobium sp. 17-62-19]OYX91341.1 MAG: exopolyphosphatase [Novosphingobium sp. 35-62-5]OZA18727.1 MAG: exopolyphosphatase [Novosphingobium sp. 17-62-19]HQS97328.1 Ppx/GppA phosphatase family protein [Novosphingobium sp.]